MTGALTIAEDMVAGSQFSDANLTDMTINGIRVDDVLALWTKNGSS